MAFQELVFGCGRRGTQGTGYGHGSLGLPRIAPASGSATFKSWRSIGMMWETPILASETRTRLSCPGMSNAGCEMLGVAVRLWHGL